MAEWKMARMRQPSAISDQPSVGTRRAIEMACGRDRLYTLLDETIVTCAAATRFEDRPE